MKTRWNRVFAGAVLACLAGMPKVSLGAAHTLQVEMAAHLRSVPLTFHSESMTNRAGQAFSVSRVDFLISAVWLRDASGSWIQPTNAAAYISLGEGRSSFNLHDIPEGRYDRIRYRVGVEPAINHGDPAQYAADHPLNPNLNGLHWSWAQGYVFCAIEGHWRDKEEKLRGYSFHLGNDPQLMTVELPIALHLQSDSSMRILLSLDQLFDFEFNDENSSTHSREGDALAPRLKSNVEGAFKSIGAEARSHWRLPSETVPQPLLAKTATPYRFSFSAQFPMPELPRDNPLTEEGVELGRMLFFEKKLSKDNVQSCASCHQQEAAFVDAGRRFSVGADGREGHRNSMPIFNMAWKKSFFWDGRAPSLRQQVLEPIQNPIEMHETLTNVAAKLASQPGYPQLFERAFGNREIDADRIARTLEQFVLTQLSFDSKFDRAMEGKEELSEEERRGFELFITEYDPRREQFGADCFHCHGGPFFTTHGFANNGLNLEYFDFGRYEVTRNEADKLKFAVPSLRNVELTAPYMHDGRFQTLEEVIEHYTSGVKRSATLDPNLAKHPEGGVPLNTADKKALVAFLKTLTDQKFGPTGETADQIGR